MLDNIQAALFVISIQETAQVKYFYGTIVVGVFIGTIGEV